MIETKLKRFKLKKYVSMYIFINQYLDQHGHQSIESGAQKQVREITPLRIKKTRTSVLNNIGLSL